MRRLSILLLGNVRRAEFRDAQSSLDRWGLVKNVETIEAAESFIADGSILPDVIVAAQARPGQYSAQDLERLRRRSPLSRVLGLLGSWCEGESRTGYPWPAAVRTYWHQWKLRCDRELGALSAGQCSSWTLPVTATEEERLLYVASHGTGTCRKPLSPKNTTSPDISHNGRESDSAAMGKRPIRTCNQGLVVIDTLSREIHDWLSAACRCRGFSTLWQRPSAAARVEGATIGLFERPCLAHSNGPQNNDGALRRFVAQLHPAPVVALLDFPRIEDIQCAQSAGATATLSKPLATEDLFLQLDMVAGRF